VSSAVTAGKSGSFAIGGDLSVHRLSFGWMRLTGRGIWGPPADRDEALRTLRRLPELEGNFIDTAKSYGPEIAQELICEALYPYKKMVIATMARTAPDAGTPLGRPEYLIQQAKLSCRRLKVEQIGLWQLHRIDGSRSRPDAWRVPGRSWRTSPLSTTLRPARSRLPGCSSAAR
jgi:pyridoxine 4-dehydrogenase